MQPITATSTPRERDETYFLLFGLQNGQRTWRGVWLLIGYYLFSLLFAAVMSAPTYWFVEWVDSFWSTEASQYLLGKNIDVYFERLRMGPLLLGLPWIMWMCRLLSFKALGFDFSWKHVKTACLWWVIGFVLIGLMAAGQVGSGTCVPREQLPSLGTQIFSSAFAALLIGFLEELIFRGLVLRLFYSAFGAFWAVVLSAAFYAYTHFRIPGGIVDVTPGDDAFFTGFQVGFWILFGIVKGFNWNEFLILFGLGCALGQLFLKVRTLLPCVGLHAGIVFVMMMHRSFYRIPEESIFWGGTGFKTGLAPLLLVIILNICIFIWAQRGRKTIGEIPAQIKS